MTPVALPSIADLDHAVNNLTDALSPPPTPPRPVPTAAGTSKAPSRSYAPP
ncbi:hypothetical protein JCM18920_1500 [Cutibacterium acnes JCM 18920]|nr:hypothetical protein JCM18920_1500 [Cutibacterium acnes JCM 18920]